MRLQSEHRKVDVAIIRHREFAGFCPAVQFGYRIRVGVGFQTCFANEEENDIIAGAFRSFDKVREGWATRLGLQLCQGNPILFARTTDNDAGGVAFHKEQISRHLDANLRQFHAHRLLGLGTREPPCEPLPPGKR